MTLFYHARIADQLLLSNLPNKHSKTKTRTGCRSIYVHIFLRRDSKQSNKKQNKTRQNKKQDLGPISYEEDTGTRTQ